MMLVVKNPAADAGDMKDRCLIPGSGRTPGEGHGNPFSYSCLENPVDRGPGVLCSWGHKELDTTNSGDLAHTHAPFLQSQTDLESCV